MKSCNQLKSLVAFALAAALAMTLSACGSDDDSSGNSSNDCASICEVARMCTYSHKPQSECVAECQSESAQGFYDAPECVTSFPHPLRYEPRNQSSRESSATTCDEYFECLANKSKSITGGVSTKYDGTWKADGADDDYIEYLRIGNNNSAYFCVFDLRSSVAVFDLGLYLLGHDATLSLSEDGKALSVSGTKKGDIYTSTYALVADTEYPTCCQEQAAGLGEVEGLGAVPICPIQTNDGTITCSVSEDCPAGAKGEELVCVKDQCYDQWK